MKPNYGAPPPRMGWGPGIGLAVAVIAVAVVVVMLLKFTEPKPPAPPVHDGPPPMATGRYAADLKDCANRGGKPSKGPFGEDICVFTFSDGGKACNDGSQCQAGSCNYEPKTGLDLPKGPLTGTCQPRNLQYGCYASLTKGRAEGVLCVD